MSNLLGISWLAFCLKSGFHFDLCQVWGVTFEVIYFLNHIRKIRAYKKETYNLLYDLYGSKYKFKAAVAPVPVFLPESNLS